MKVNPVELVPLDKLHNNLSNPKKPMGTRYLKGLRIPGALRLCGSAGRGPRPGRHLRGTGR